MIYQVFSCRKGWQTAKCRHCVFYHGKETSLYLGWCDQRRSMVNFNAIYCDKFKPREWLVVNKSSVQLNLFEDEKSVQDIPAVCQENPPELF